MAGRPVDRRDVTTGQTQPGLDLRAVVAGVRKHGDGQWRIQESGTSLLTASRLHDMPGHELITDVLRGIASPDIAAWIPFRRLQELGGVLDWTHPLDNGLKQQADQDIPPTGLF